MTAHCPNLVDLSAFAEGRLASPSWETIADHVSTCAECAVRLREIPYGADSVVLHLREAAARQGDAARVGVAGRAGDRPGGADDTSRQAIDLSTSEQTDGKSTDGRTAELDTQPRLAWPLAAVDAVGHYRILEKLGEGGMGVVYKAVDTKLHRVVAVKMISAGAHSSQQAVARFVREGQAIARLAHPGVVKVHEFDVHEGRPYLVMEYFEEGTLSKKLVDWNPSFAESAECVRQLAEAVQAAHAGKILHRDVKPSNVLLSANLEPKLSDFGLAKLLDADDGHTLSDEILGTASYMAPEQAEGRVAEISPATDVYGLGAVLYEMLTKRPPFKEGSRMKTLDAVRTAPLVPPSSINPSVPRELEAVCLKCLAKSPAKRYAAAAELSQELQKWLAGRRTDVRPTPKWRSFLRRHWIAAATAAALLLLAAAAPIVAHYADPDRPIEQIEAALVRGEKVMLIGATGGPKWSRWSSGEATSRASLAPDGAFTIDAQESCLLELIRDPHASRYRIEADVRHNFSGTQSCTVGIYFAHREYSTPRGKAHAYDEFVYDDIEDVRQTFLDIASRVDDKVKAAIVPPLGNPAMISHRFVADWRNDSIWRVKTGGQVVGIFQAATVPTWRRLEVEVTPKMIVGRWDRNDAPVPISVVALEGDAARMLEYLRETSPDDPLHDRFDASVAPRGSLGLFVISASASFRNVSIRPLAKVAIK